MRAAEIGHAPAHHENQVVGSGQQAVAQEQATSIVRPGSLLVARDNPATSACVQGCKQFDVAEDIELSLRLGLVAGAVHPFDF